MGRDPLEDDRNRGDDEAESEEPPVRRDPQLPEPIAARHRYGFFELPCVVVVVVVVVAAFFVCPGGMWATGVVANFLSWPAAVLLPFAAGTVVVVVVLLSCPGAVPRPLAAGAV
jgi:hypothetical protein